MEGIENIGAFIAAGILLNITPGSDTMFIITRSISGGRSHGIYSAIGINVGSIAHTIMVSLGLSAIIVQSAFLFGLVKYAGAFYLIYLGLNSIFKRRNGSFKNKAEKVSGKEVFISGVLANLLNPRVALFFLAFLPQFVDVRFAHSPYPFLILGLIFTTTGTIWSLILAIMASRFSKIFQRNYRIGSWLSKLSGIVFILLGLKIAFVQRK